jgi:hypothetical protein
MQQESPLLSLHLPQRQQTQKLLVSQKDKSLMSSQLI